MIESASWAARPVAAASPLASRQLNATDAKGKALREAGLVGTASDQLGSDHIPQLPPSPLLAARVRDLLTTSESKRDAQRRLEEMRSARKANHNSRTKLGLLDQTWSKSERGKATARETPRGTPPPAGLMCAPEIQVCRGGIVLISIENERVHCVCHCMGVVQKVALDEGAAGEESGGIDLGFVRRALMLREEPGGCQVLCVACLHGSSSGVFRVRAGLASRAAESTAASASSLPEERRRADSAAASDFGKQHPCWVEDASAAEAFIRPCSAPC